MPDDEEALALLQRVAARIASNGGHLAETTCSHPLAQSLDPIEKVRKWNVEAKCRTKRTSGGGHHTSSCYGSLPTSPSPPAEGEEEDKEDGMKTTSKMISPAPGELDSGYPGSDRSTVHYYSLKGLSPASHGQQGQKRGDARQLFNLEEEERSHSQRSVRVEPESATATLPVRAHGDLMASADSSSLPSDYAPSPSNGRTRSPRRRRVNNRARRLFPVSAAAAAAATTEPPSSATLKPPDAHRTYLHSVTDLSSDERSMFEDAAEDQQIRPQLPSPVPTEAAGPSQSLHLPSEIKQPMSSACSTSRQPAALAQQIDREILELRSFFDDHREEMMSMLHEGHAEANAPVHYNSEPVAAISPDQLMHFHADLGPKRRGSAADSGTDVGDLAEERRREFERRRQQRASNKKKHIQQQLIRSSSSPVHVVDGQCEPQKRNSISALFPKMSASSAGGSAEANKASTCSLDVGQHGRHVTAPDGSSVFIPRLHLDDVWTDEEARDPRSFDFHQSLASINQHRGAGGGDGHHQRQIVPPSAAPGYPARVACSERDIAASCSSTAELIRSQSTGHLAFGPAGGAHSARGQPQQPLVVVQTCCRGCNGQKYHPEQPSASARVRHASASTSTHNLSSSLAALSVGSARSKRKSKSKSKARKELKQLLASLEQANKLAVSLKERSEDLMLAMGDDLRQEEKEEVRRHAPSSSRSSLSLSTWLRRK